MDDELRTNTTYCWMMSRDGRRYLLPESEIPSQTEDFELERFSTDSHGAVVDLRESR